MYSLLLSVESFFVSQLWPLSLQIALLVVLIWFATLALRRFAPRYRYALWLVLLLRLLIPMQIHSPIGVLHPWTDHGIQANLDVGGGVGTTRTDVGKAAVTRDQSVQKTKAQRITRTAIHGGTLFWLAMVSLLTLVVTLRWLRLARVKRYFTTVVRQDVLTCFAELNGRILPRQRIAIVQADGNRGLRLPAVVGLLRPTIVLPDSMVEQWELSDLEPVFLHELTHIKRQDHWLNLIQIIVQTAYFFHPLVWLANSRLRVERELACDDEVVRMTSGDITRYVRVLLAAAESIATQPQFALAALAMAESKSDLSRRVKRMVSDNYSVLAKRGVISFLPFILLGAFVLALAADEPTPTAGGTKSEINVLFNFPKAFLGPQREPIEVNGDITMPKRISDSSKIQYPADAKAAGIGGVVVLRGQIDEQGKVNDLVISEGADPRLDKECLDYVQRLRYEPGVHKNGQSVALEFRAKCTFSPVRSSDLPDTKPTLHPGWEEEFKDQYALADGQVIKLITPPYPPSRIDFYWARNPGQARAIPAGPTSMRLLWQATSGELELAGCFFGPDELVNTLLGLDLKRYQIQGSKELLEVRVAGDLVMRKDALLVDYVAALQGELNDKCNLGLHLMVRDEPRQVFVARGRYQFTPLPGGVPQDNIHVYHQKLNGDPTRGAGGSVSLDFFLSYMLPFMLDVPIISEVEGAKAIKVSCRIHDDAHSTKYLDEVLANVSKQTGIEFVKEVRPVQIVHVEKLN